MNKVIYLNKLWKSINFNKKMKRSIKEITFENININEYVVIDVRSRREFKENHLNGAINIPLPEVKRKITIYAKDKNKKILGCCQSGIRSARAVEMLEDLILTAMNEATKHAEELVEAEMRRYNVPGGLNGLL